MIKLPLLSYKEGEYDSFNDSGVEQAVGELLYSFVRILRPFNVLDLGTAKGISAAYMAMGCRDNEKGMVHTVEFDPAHWQEANDLWERIKVGPYVHQYKCRAEEYSSTFTYHLILVDTVPEERFKQIIQFYPFLEEGGYMFMHDAPYNLCQGNINPDHPEFKSWPYGDIPKEIETWVQDDKLRPFFFPNPRGFMGLYKVRPDEYKWF